MFKQIALVLFIVVFFTLGEAAVVRQKLKDKIREEELKEQQKLKLPSNDNDEEATTVRVADPPIQNQFANVLQSGVGQLPPSPPEQEQEVEESEKKAEESEKEEEEEEEDEVKQEIKSKQPEQPPKKKRVPPKPSKVVSNKEEGQGVKTKVTSEESKKEEEEKKDEEDEEEDEDEEARRKRKLKNNFFRKALDCGYHRLKPGDVRVVSFGRNSSNHLRQKSSCVWEFFGHHCIIRTTCRCFEVQRSLDCKQNYLKFTDNYSFAERFCGERKPSKTYVSTTNNLIIRFKSDVEKEPSSNESNGFLCHVSCAGPGKMEPTFNATCPN